MKLKRICALAMVFAMLCPAPALANSPWKNIFDTVVNSGAFDSIPIKPAATPSVTASVIPSATPAPESTPSATIPAEPTATPGAAYAEQILPEYSKIILGVGESVPLPGYQLLPEGAQDSVTYLASENRLSITKKGTFSVRKEGKYTLTLQASGGAQAEVSVVVKSAPKSVKLSADRSELGVGETLFCSAVLPEGSAGGVSFDCNKPEILRSNGDGSFTALSPGSASITATTFNKKTSTLKVKVLPAPAEIYLDTAEMKMGVGDSDRIGCSFPEGTIGQLYFESLHPELIQCSPSGELRAICEGTAIIRVRALNSDAQADCIVHVLPAPEEMLLSENSIDILLGQIRPAGITFLPEGSYSCFTCLPDDNTIVSIDAVGNICGMNPGRTNVRITSASGHTAELAVTVLEAPKWIRLSHDHVNLSSGESIALSWEYPENSYSKAEFTSSRPDIASVDPESGLVQALSAGTAVISVQTLNGKTDSCTVNVDMDADFISSGEEDFEIIFMNIGRNDGILIRCGDEYAFIDAGYYSYAEKAVRFMKQQGVTELTYYIGTHAHRDHIGGAGIILNAFPTEMIIVPHEYCLDAILEFCRNDDERAAVRGTPSKIFTLGQQLYLGNAKISCLGPVNYTHYHHSVIFENGNSLVARITYGDNSFLLTGDATAAELQEIDAHSPGSLLSDLLKNPHHDADLPKNVVSKVKPKITIFSTTSSGWPDHKYVEILRGMGSDIYSTAPARNGNISVRSNGSTINVYPQQGEAFPGHKNKDE